MQLEEIVLIEFSRNDYEKAFQQFSREFLQDAYFLYLNVDLEICKRRIRERIANPNTQMTILSLNISSILTIMKMMGKIYLKFSKEIMVLNKQRVKVIDNNELTADSIATWINQFVDTYRGAQNICENLELGY